MKYAMNLEMKGRRCVVLGGGPVALRKVRRLVRAEAAVTVIAPMAVMELAELALARRIQWQQRGYEESDLDGAFLVVCATNDADVNVRAAEAAKKRGALVNAPAQPALSDFTVPASLSRGKLLFTISTDGGSPALSRAIRQQLEALYPKSFGNWLEMVAALREEQKERLATARDRERFWRMALDDGILQLVRAGRLDEAKEKVRNAAHLSGTQS